MNKLKKSQSNSSDSSSALYCLFTILGLCLVVLLFYSFQFTRWGHDGIHHIAALAELYQPFSRWQFNTLLSPELHYGNGLPTYIYYSQWLYIPPYLFTLLGFGLTPAFALTFITLTIIAWVGFYKLALNHVSNNIAALAATLFITSNYFLGDIYTRFAYGEIVGYALLPLSFFATHKAFLDKNHGAIAYPIVMFSIIILTYPMVLMNSAPLLLLYCWMILPSKKEIAAFFIKGVAIMLITLSLTAFFWLPGLVESSYVLGGTAVGAHYTRGFWTFDNAIFELQDEHSLGPILNIAIIGAFAMHMIFSRNLRKAYYLLAGIVIYVFISFEFSIYIWELIPLLQANMHATRFLIPMSLAACLYVALNIEALNSKKFNGRLIILLSVLMLLQGGLLIHKYTSEYNPDPQNLANIFTEDLNAEISYRANFAKRHIDGPGVTEFKPKVNLPLPGFKVSESDCQQKIKLPFYIEDIQREAIVVNYDVDHSGCYLRMPVFWNVRYRAHDEAGEALATGYNDDGVLMVKVAKEAGAIAVQFSDLSYVRLAKYISTSTLILIFISMIMLVFSRYRKSR